MLRDGSLLPHSKETYIPLLQLTLTLNIFYTKSCPNRVIVLDHLESLRLFVASAGRTRSFIRTDNEFVTSLAAHWARQHNIQFNVSIPFEHDTVRLVECTHRTLQEMTVKRLAFKSHLSSAYWRFAYQHNAALHNITPGNNSSPYLLWHGHPFDLIKTPILPFGSINAADRRLETQTALSGRSQEAVFVGIAHAHAGGIILYNPATKRTFI